MVLIIREKIAAVLATALFMALSPGAAPGDSPKISADCAVVMHEDGQIVYAKNADKRALIASTTKLMTALVALENADLEDAVEIKPEYCNIEGSSMYLRQGQRLSVRELLLGLLLASGNDAATALAGYTAGSQRSFVSLMNKKATALGMRDSRFANPHGLDDKGHYSTARDMAKLMAACMDNREFRTLCGTRSAAVGDEQLVNHNRLLDICTGCIAGKTGYTMAAGRCLVSCCEREGTRFICVTLSAPDDWNDQLALYDWAFSRYSLRRLTDKLRFDVPVISGSAETVGVEPAETLDLFLPKSAEVELRAEMPQFVFAPINLGETAGNIWVIINGEPVMSCELVYSADVEPAQLCGKTVLEKL